MGKKVRIGGKRNGKDSPGIGTSFAILRTILPILEADNVSPVNGRRSVIYIKAKKEVRCSRSKRNVIFQFCFFGLGCYFWGL